MSESIPTSSSAPMASEPLTVPLLTPADLAIEPGQPLDGPSKTVVSDLINAHGFVLFAAMTSKAMMTFIASSRALGWTISNTQIPSRTP